MPDFPGEGDRDLINDAPADPPKKAERLIKVAIKRAPRAVIVPPPPTRVHKPLRVEETRRNDIAQVARDFKEGIDALQRLLRTSPGAVGGSNLPGHEPERESATSVTSKETINTIIERELRTIERVSAQRPASRHHVPTLVNDFKHRAQAVFDAQVPQALAAVMQVDKEFRASRQPHAIRPGVALRPKRGSPVEALMKVAKSIRAGRLPFVPAETRKSAQQLVNAVVGRVRGRQMSTMSKETTKLIERHSLVPLAVHNAMTASVPQEARSPGGEHTRHSERLETILREITQPANSARRSGAIPISEAHARQLATAIPRFESGGGVYGGAAIIDAGESMENVGGVDTIYREGSSHVQAPEASSINTTVPRAAAATRSAPTAPAARAATRSAPTAPAASAPQAEPHKTPTEGSAGSNQTHGGLGTGQGGGTVGASGGPLKIEGKLTIDGMRDWVANIQGKISNV